jgi:ABC-2 type transport system ATP-binding protein
MATPIIFADKLCKRFPAHRTEIVDAVRNLDLEVGKGEIFGLIGPNGAGKTTAMRMLCTLLVPSSGRATVTGFDLATQAGEIRRHIGYVGQKGGMEQAATGRENLILHGQLYRLSNAEATSRTEALIDRLKLTGFADRKVETYSGGQRRLFDLASGVINSPELLFLDEPTTGLDPNSRARVWEEVRGLHERGTSIFLTTHYLEEADALCDRVAIIDLGHIVALDRPAELKKQIAGDIITLGCGTADQVRVAAKLLDATELVLESHQSDASLQLYVDRGDEALPTILRTLGQGGFAPESVHLSRPSLDDVFLKLTGRSLRQSENEHA